MLTRLRRALREESGFTLIELLIVIVILGILAAIVVFAVNGIQNRGTASACRSDVETVTVAAEAYNAQHGRYAKSMKQLVRAGLLHSVPSDSNYTIDYQRVRDSKTPSVSVSSSYCPDAGASGPATSEPPSSAPPGNVVVYRVNAGGPEVTTLDDGPNWSSDYDSTSPLRTGDGGGGSSRFDGGIQTDGSVPSSTPNEIFNSERFDLQGDGEMQWAFPVDAADQYTVRLYFANRCGCTAYSGARVFDVAIDGNPVLTNYDIFADVGYVGTMKQFTGLSEPDGTINIDFGHVTENPLIDAIEIIDTSPISPR